MLKLPGFDLATDARHLNFFDQRFCAFAAYREGEAPNKGYSGIG